MQHSTNTAKPKPFFITKFYSTLRLMVKEERGEEEKEKSSLFPVQWTNFKGKRKFFGI